MAVKLWQQQHENIFAKKKLEVNFLYSVGPSYKSFNPENNFRVIS
jgi:hypothetical protein